MLKKLSILFIVVVCQLSFFSFIFAQDVFYPNTSRDVYYPNSGGRGGVTISNPLSGVADDIPGLIGYILYLARWFAGTIAVLMIVVGAYQILFAGANPQSFELGKKTIIYAVIGFAIVLLAEIVVDIIRELVG